MIAAGGIDRVILVDLHSRAGEGFFSVPAEHLSAIAAAGRALLAAGCTPDISVVVTHGLFASRAEEVLRDLPIARVITTDSITQRADLRLPLQVVLLAPLLAEVIRRLDRDLIATNR